ncbi:MAG: hypothetical protein CMI60_01135 [Parvibaculum sp.]|nr:hypothetical protein [Parvibaculum sp.]|tara:strand:+ start:1038 stop:1337 length:300 start_codon:yes stop_codon:yes gene_type:complete
MSLAEQSIDLSDIERFQKQGIRSDAQTLLGKVIDEENPLKGITSQQRKRNLEASDVLNIGSGTRCQHCGMLHFMWRETCATCDKPMEYNLASIDEEARA